MSYCEHGLRRLCYGIFMAAFCIDIWIVLFHQVLQGRKKWLLEIISQLLQLIFGFSLHEFAPPLLVIHLGFVALLRKSFFNSWGNLMAIMEVAVSFSSYRNFEGLEAAVGSLKDRGFRSEEEAHQAATNCISFHFLTGKGISYPNLVVLVLLLFVLKKKKCWNFVLCYTLNSWMERKRDDLFWMLFLRFCCKLMGEISIVFPFLISITMLC